MEAEQMDPRDERIGRILNEYLDRKRLGEVGVENKLLEANPDLADELRAHFGMVNQVRSASSHGEQDDGPMAALPPDALPGYEILGEIHRGGQGVVYQAMQQGTKRMVAIKVMREGPFAGWRDRARFEREVRVLGSLNHPSIVTIHESGTASGCQYVVMDYIAGLPLDVWLGSRPRSIDEILKLFATICDAVNAAHIKGIIHRDLKPGNIRISEEGKPHVLDFGLAKVTSRDQEDARPADMTQVGQFVGSLPWTSPEQAQGTLDNVDTRTDVYALGVILYQLLTGTFPYEIVGPMRDVLNRIVTSQPVRPSTLRGEIDRDLEAIVLKCLDKEPRRRYQTAGELGRDIDRYMKGEPIAARSDSGLYLFGKMLRRYRVPVAVATAFAILVGASFLASLSLWRRATVERDRAVVAQQEADRERGRADAKAAEAEQARTVAEQERAGAQDQARQLRRAGYLNRVALARNAYERKYLTQVRQLLDACPADLRGWEWYYLSRLSRRSTLLDVRADPECVVALAINPSGDRIVTGGCDGIVKMFNPATGSPIAEFKGHTGQVNALAFSPDGRWIASGGRDRTLRLWDSRTGSQKILQEGVQRVNCVGFSPEGTALVAGGQSKTLTFWEIPSGRILGTTGAQGNEIACVAYSPGGERVACGEFLTPSAGGSRIRIWDGATRKSLAEWVAHPGAVLSIAYSPDGTRIASGGGIAPGGKDARGTLKIFDAATGNERLSLRGHEGFVDCVAFSPDGKLLASAGMPQAPGFGMEADRTLKIWDATSGEELCTYSAHSRGARAVVWSPDASRVFSAGMDGRLKAWPSRMPAEARYLAGHAGAVMRIAFSPDGKRLASAGGQGENLTGTGLPPDNTVRVWNLETGAQSLVLNDHKNAVLGLAWSPDGRYIASGGEDKTIIVWDAATGQRNLLLASPEAVQGVAFSPDGRLLGGIAGSKATIWKFTDASKYCEFSPGETLLTLGFSRNGRWIATSSANGEVQLWDVEGCGQYCRITSGAGLNGAWFAPDSKTIATAHTNGTIVLWDIATSRPVTVIRGPQCSVEWLDFSPDGQRIVSCTADMMMQVWDVPSASEVYSVRAHDMPVRCVKFSPDGGSIASCGQEGLIKLWEAQPISASQPR